MQTNAAYANYFKQQLEQALEVKKTREEWAKEIPMNRHQRRAQASILRKSKYNGRGKPRAR
jgi:hypothetical protein